MTELTFGVSIGAVDVPGKSDEELYKHFSDDIDFVARSGFDGVWALEHHFSDYFPTPSPLLVLANAAGRWPELELGTMVIVAPWYQPLRLAEEIAMLSLLTKASIHVGLGRGSAASEYEAFGMDLDESRGRFKEAVQIMQLAFKGKPFTYSGMYNEIATPIELRPRPRMDRVNIYGAISSPQTAKIMAELHIPPLSNASRPLDMHQQVLDTWNMHTATLGGSTKGFKPLQSHLIVADTDEEAADLARKYMPQFFQAQVDHYATDLERYEHLETYEMRNMHNSRVRLTDPKNLDEFIALNLIGSPETIKKKLNAWIDVGFNKFIVTTNTPGIPEAVRHHWLTRFANEIRPAFKSTPKKHVLAVAA